MFNCLSAQVGFLEFFDNQRCFFYDSSLISYWAKRSLTVSSRKNFARKDFSIRFFSENRPVFSARSAVLLIPAYLAEYVRSDFVDNFVCRFPTARRGSGLNKRIEHSGNCAKHSTKRCDHFMFWRNRRWKRISQEWRHTIGYDTKPLGTAALTAATDYGSKRSLRALVKKSRLSIHRCLSLKCKLQRNATQSCRVKVNKQLGMVYRISKCRESWCKAVKTDWSGTRAQELTWINIQGRTTDYRSNIRLKYFIV